MEYYFSDSTLIRKEHFGTLVLLGNGHRYLLKREYFEILKEIDKHHTIKNINNKTIGISEQKTNILLQNLVEKGIIIGQRKSNGANIRFIENAFISNDCLSFPRTIYWECTEKCNYKCIHCYSSSGEKTAYAGMSFSVVKRMIDEIVKHGTEFLSIGGGEPILYPHLFEVIEYATRRGLAVEITTNGSLLTKKNIKHLVESGLRFIQVSLDGVQEQTYLKIRKSGNFQKVINVLPELAKKFTLAICVVVNKINYSEIKSLIDFSKKVGAKHFRVIPLMEVGRGAKNNSLQLSKNELKNLHSFIVKKKKAEKYIHIQLNENLVSPKIKNIPWMPENHFGCSATRSTCSIDARGNVYPCSFMTFKELRCGNINKATLLEIWAKSPIMKKMRTLDNLVGKCSTCKYLKLCRGGCRAAAYLKNKRLNDSDYLCSVI